MKRRFNLDRDFKCVYEIHRQPMRDERAKDLYPLVRREFKWHVRVASDSLLAGDYHAPEPTFEVLMVEIVVSKSPVVEVGDDGHQYRRLRDHAEVVHRETRLTKFLTEVSDWVETDQRSRQGDANVVVNVLEETLFGTPPPRLRLKEGWMTEHVPDAKVESGPDGR